MHRSKTKRRNNKRSFLTIITRVSSTKKPVHNLLPTHFRICSSCRICRVCFGVEIFALGTILRAHSVFVAMWTDITTCTSAPRERGEREREREWAISTKRKTIEQLGGGAGMLQRRVPSQRLLCLRFSAIESHLWKESRRFLWAVPVVRTSLWIST